MKTNPLAKFVTKTLVSTASSIVSSEIKKHAKVLIDKYTAKTTADAAREVAERLGYPTTNFILHKNGSVIFKSSAIFMHEWLCKSPITSGKLLKDEENGTVYYDGQILTNSVKVELLNRFTKITNINSPAVSGHFDKAVELLDPTDFTSIKFRKMFSGWEFGKPSIINSWLTNVFGSAVETDVQYANMLFRRWIVGTARRALEPGSNHDGCFVLKGPAGVGKTLHFRKLLPEELNRTGEIYCDVKSPQRFVEAIVGKTIACFDELSVLENSKSDETFKQLLSSQFIDVRLAWARKTRRYALRQGFCATTNRDKFINDPFLSRRLWAIELNNSQRINLDYLQENRTALWQEAVYLVDKGESSVLSVDEQKLVEKYNKRFLI